jgi:hypothetical protein
MGHGRPTVVGQHTEHDIGHDQIIGTGQVS